MNTSAQNKAYAYLKTNKNWHAYEPIEYIY